MSTQTAALRLCEACRSDSPKALLAEADELLRSRIATALREAGYEVLEAADGFEALDALLALLPWRKVAPGVDLVLAGADMPGYDGLEVLARLRAMGNLTPFILMSGGGHPATCREAARLGADRILEGPATLDEVTRAALGLVPVGAKAG